MAVLGTALYTYLALAHAHKQLGVRLEKCRVQCSRDIIVAWLGRFSWKFFPVHLSMYSLQPYDPYSWLVLYYIHNSQLCTLCMCVCARVVYE